VVAAVVVRHRRKTLTALYAAATKKHPTIAIAVAR